MPSKILFYSSSNGRQYVINFIKKLDQKTQANCLHLIDILEKYGNEIERKYSKKIIYNLYELRILGKKQVRIFYTINNNSIILLHGFIKKSNRIPQKELEIAKRRLKDINIDKL